MSRPFYHEHPDWVGFRLNLCGDSDQMREALRRVTTYALAASSVGKPLAVGAKD